MHRTSLIVLRRAHKSLHDTRLVLLLNLIMLQNLSQCKLGQFLKFQCTNSECTIGTRVINASIDCARYSHPSCKYELAPSFTGNIAHASNDSAPASNNDHGNSFYSAKRNSTPNTTSSLV